MNIFKIHDLSDTKVISILESGLSEVDDVCIVKNYHPDYADRPENLFFILKQGRYQQSRGAYFVVEENGEYICSAGWNKYTPDIALVLTRAYTAQKYRMQYLLAKHILTKAIEETKHYDKVWLTANEHNKVVYNWFVRNSENKRSALFNDWPEIYKSFKPIGKKNVYDVEQYVVELQRKLYE